MNPNELNALIVLLEDPDEVIYSHVKGKFLSFGQEVIPHLEAAWDDCFDEILQKRIESIIHSIQNEVVSKALKKWATESQEDLLTGIMIVSRFQYPNFDENKFRNKITQITKDIWIEVNDELTALEKIKIVNHILFDVQKFKGNTDNYYTPENSFIHSVLENKTGNHISLSIIYMIICKELNIPVFGVDLPQHFILAYVDDFPSIFEITNNPTDNILFYINPFADGAIFRRTEIDEFLKQQGIEHSPNYYKPCNNLDIIKRVLRNIIFSFEKKGNKTEELKELLNELNILL